MPRFDVTLAGELQLDLILYGVPEELPRERELVADGMMLTLGGSSTNAAHNLAALGSRVGFIAQRVSGDTKTGITVVLQRENWRNMVSYLGTICELTFEDLDLEYLADSRHFHLSSFYLQGGLQPRVPELFRKLKSAGLTISLDTNDDPVDRWQGGIHDTLPFVDVFLPNEREAVKLGAGGAIAQRGRETFRSPAIDVTVVDAVGAGDSFNAGFLSQYVRGADLPACLAAGNLAGAFSATRPGGTEAFIDHQHWEQFFRQHAAQPSSQVLK